MTQPTEDDLERFLAEECSVRELARSLAADPDDVVQQTWLQASQHRGAAIDLPRAWLKSVAWNVVRNFQRSERRRRERERTVAPPDVAPSSAELAVREERRRQIIEALSLIHI